MDQMMIDIDQATVYNGTEVTLIGTSGAHAITVNQLADWCQSSPYELLVRLDTRVQRRYIQN